jgi:hypothetical protein
MLASSDPSQGLALRVLAFLSSSIHLGEPFVFHAFLLRNRFIVQIYARASRWKATVSQMAN